MIKRLFSISGIILFILFFSTISCNTKKSLNRDLFVIDGSTMGTTFSVKIVKNNFLLLGNNNERIEKLKAEINNSLEGVNNMMSTYRPDSELSRFNSFRGKEWFSVSSDTAMVVNTSLEISRRSGGKFDVTVGPLVNIWGFGKDFMKKELPSRKKIEELKKITGYKNLKARLNPPALKKNIPELYCDLSAIAKGFAVDKIAGILDSKGFLNYLIEIGGEIRVRGNKGDGLKWMLGIQSPGSGGGLSKIVALTDISMATSGDYRNYFEKDEKKYSHTIDPETGYPVTHSLASVTVLHRSCMIADAYATAINVLGPVDGYKFAIKEKIPLFMIEHNGKGFKKKMTPLFKEVLKNNN